MTGCICPTCHRPMKSGLPIKSLTDLSLGPRERRIVEILSRAYPHEVSSERMVEHVYSHDKGGGPLGAAKTLAVILVYLRPKVRQYGWTISKARSGPGSPGVRLEPVR